LRIGAFCSIAVGVKIFLGGEHRLDWVTTYPFNIIWEKGRGIKGHPKTKGDVVVGNDVLIGAEALILSGVTIGDGAVIGARAIVTRNIPSYAIAVGNPARVVKKRFDEETIGRLMTIKWWDWDDARIEKALPMLLNNDIEAFLQAAESNKI
jgi:chloramphenicol O-acetyltransferase type B